MPAGGFRTFVAGEVLDEDDINDYLMQGVLVFGGTAARDSAIGTPVEGQFAFLTDTDTLTYYDSSAWQEYRAGFTSARVSATSGSPGTGTYTDAAGFDVDYYEFTGNGSITFDVAGYADVLVVGGGGASTFNSSKAGGGAGAVRYGAVYFSATTHTITIGAGGSGKASDEIANNGSDSSIGTVVVAGGGSGGIASGDGNQGDLNKSAVDHGGGDGGLYIDNVSAGSAAGGGAGSGSAGLSLNYVGSAVTYGVGGSSATPVANTGSGGDFDSDGGAGSDGVVIVKVLS